MSDVNARDWVEDNAGELVRDGVPPELAAAIAADAELAAMARGAEALRGHMDAWRDEAPPDDLVERSLARIALAAAVGGPVDGEGVGAGADQGEAAGGAARAGEVIPFPTQAAPRPKRRSTVIEVLTSAPLAETPSEAPSRQRLVLRLAIQVAAAVVLFGISSTFVAVFYPAVTFALEERDVHHCQEQLERLHAAALRYRAEHPEAKRLRGAELRRALIRGGYAAEADFTCPSRRGRQLGLRSYQGDLPAGSEELDATRPLFWDTFSNHGTGFNVVRGSGKVAQIAVDDLNTLWQAQQKDEGVEGGAEVGQQGE